jgi:transposase
VVVGRLERDKETRRTVGMLLVGEFDVHRSNIRMSKNKQSAVHGLTGRIGLRMAVGLVGDRAVNDVKR